MATNGARTPPDILDVRFEAGSEGSLVRSVQRRREDGAPSARDSQPWKLPQVEPSDFRDRGIRELLAPLSPPDKARLRIWPALEQQQGAVTPAYAWWSMRDPRNQGEPLLKRGWTITQVSATGIKASFQGAVFVFSSEPIRSALHAEVGADVQVKAAQWDSWVTDDDAQWSVLVAETDSADRIRQLRATARELKCPVVVWLSGKPPADQTELIEVVRRPGAVSAADPTEWVTAFVRALVEGLVPEEAHRRASLPQPDVLFELRNYAEEWSSFESRLEAAIRDRAALMAAESEAQAARLPDGFGASVVVATHPPDQGRLANGIASRIEADRGTENVLSWRNLADDDDPATRQWESLKRRFGARTGAAIFRAIAASGDDASAWVTHHAIDVAAQPDGVEVVAAYLAKLNEAAQDDVRLAFPRARLHVFVPLLCSDADAAGLAKRIAPATPNPHFSFQVVRASEPVAPPAREAPPSSRTRRLLSSLFRGRSSRRGGARM